MTKATRENGRATPSQVRCAVYTRKSTEEGLEQEFNSLDAQRESAEAFIKSQASEGWTCLPERYDDGGFSGGTMGRPALRRLLADIAAGKVDLVVTYKVDRLSRSLLDFAKMMATFEEHRVSFVSVTQQFNTATSMGRLVLNVLLSFAQFEREIISERTRDKIAATRRRGKWAGGMPLLGYDVDPRGSKLQVNEGEAARVRAIFALYLEHEALLPVVKELDARGWRNKRWRTRRGPERGGKPFTRTSLYKLLTNATYIGKVRYKSELHDGEHAAIVDPGLFERVQATMRRNGSTGGAPVRNQFGMILQGLLRCAPCGCSMTPSFTTRKKVRRYRYYTCTNAQKRGWDTCPSKSVPAGSIEEFVVDQVRCVVRDPALLNEVLAQARQQDEARAAELETEQRGLEKDLAAWHGEVQKLAGQVRPGDDNGPLIARLADLQERIATVEGRVLKVRHEIHAIHHTLLDEDEARTVLAAFDPVWESLAPREQSRVVQLLVQQVDYDGGTSKVTIKFRPTAIKTLADELAAGRSEGERA
jgi:site-specific DNA recombinase